MTLRFRRSFRLAPGIQLNLSKSGLSASIGGKGASLNIGRRGVRETVGLPGTGLSASAQQPWHASRPRTGAPARSSAGAALALLVLLLLAVVWVLA